MEDTEENSDGQDSPIKGSSEDTVCNRYVINVNSPIEHLSNIFCRVYTATDTALTSNGVEGEYLAYIFNSSLPFRNEVVTLLHHYQEGDIIKPLVQDKIYFSPTKTKQLAIITRKIPGESLTEYVARHGPVSENFITDQFLPAMVKILQNLESLDLSHGSLSPDVIYLQGNQDIILGECFSTAPGFHQKPCYAPLERMTTNPLGRGTPDNLTDLFALGVICLYLITGEDPVNIADEETMFRNRFASGSYQYFVPGYNNMSNRMKDLLKGLLSDKRTERWKLGSVNDWIHDRRYTTVNIADNSGEASRNIIFNSKHYINYRSLAYALGKEWEAAKNFLKEDTLIKWAETSLADIDKAEKLHYILRAGSQAHTPYTQEKEENVSKTILILNPESPIYFKDIVTHLEGISFLFAYSFSQGKREPIDSLIKIIKYGLWRGSIIGIGTESRTEVVSSLENISTYLNIKGLGFGIERFLYELCPQLSCQSKILEGSYASTLEELLLIMDKKSQEKDIEIIDSHIASYIATKLKVTSEVKLSHIPEFIRFEKNRELLALFLLANAQKVTKIAKLIGLSKLVVKKLSTATDLIYNRKTKEEIRNKLQAIKENGSLLEILQIIANPNYITNDKKGFDEATIQYKKLKDQIEVLNQPTKIFEVGYRFGLKLSVMISYLITLLTFVMLMAQHIE